MEDNKKLKELLNQSLTPNPDLNNEQQDEPKKSGLGETLKRYLSPEEGEPSLMDRANTYLKEKNAEDKRVQSESTNALKDRIKMQLNPQLQGPQLPMYAATDAEKQQVENNLGLAMGTVGKTGNWMKNYKTSADVEKAIAKGEGLVPKLEESINKQAGEVAPKTYTQEKFNKLKQMMDDILTRENIPQNVKTEKLKEFNEYRRLAKTRGIE